MNTESLFHSTSENRTLKNKIKQKKIGYLPSDKYF